MVYESHLNSYLKILGGWEVDELRGAGVLWLEEAQYTQLERQKDGQYGPKWEGLA